MKHKHADILIAIAEGSNIQYRITSIGLWHAAANPLKLISEYPEYQFRVEPETDMINVGTILIPKPLKAGVRADYALGIEYHDYTFDMDRKAVLWFKTEGYRKSFFDGLVTQMLMK